MPFQHTLPITPRGIELNMEFARPFDAVHAARHLLRTALAGTLSTLDPSSGYPYGTATNLAVLPDGTPFFMAASLAIHARNIAADNRVSVALVEPGVRDALLATRLTLVGRAEAIEGAEADAAATRYLARFPKAKLYLSLPDARLFRVRVEALQIGGGPARNASDATPGALQTDLAGAEALMASEQAEIAKLNGEAPDLVAKLAAAAGGEQGRWRVCGIDPDGIDLASAETAARFWFAARVESTAALARELADPTANRPN